MNLLTSSVQFNEYDSFLILFCEVTLLNPLKPKQISNKFMLVFYLKLSEEMRSNTVAVENLLAISLDFPIKQILTDIYLLNHCLVSPDR